MTPSQTHVQAVIRAAAAVAQRYQALVACPIPDADDPALDDLAAARAHRHHERHADELLDAVAALNNVVLDAEAFAALSGPAG